MFRILTILCCTLLILSLTACMTARGAMDDNAMSGLWTDQQGRLYSLDADGVLGLPGWEDSFGADWSFRGDVLTLRTLNAPGKPLCETILTLQKKNLFSLDFRDEKGTLFRFKKSRKNVKRLDGTLFYRERILLPQDVTVCASLISPDGRRAASLRPAHGQGQLSFRIHYLESFFKKQAKLEACILYGSEPLFATTAPVAVDLDGEPSVLLHHAVPSDDANLVGTYWRLKEVDGKAAEHYPDQPEAHLILKDDGQATGSDGCNNFFMGWTTQEDRITFTPGGATLRLCPNGEEQARALYEALPAVQSFRIKNNTLELLSSGRVSAVFEAVEM